MARQVLVIDDEESIRKSLTGVLEDEGYRVCAASGGREGLELIRSQHPDVVLLDIWMPEMDGLEVLRLIKTEFSYQMVIIMSGHGNIETAVKATKLGAYDFIEKPISLEKLLLLIQNASTAQELARENQALKKKAEKNRVLVGKSAALQEIKELIARVAPTTGSILISGENGTGKEVVAHTIHALSPRFLKTFVEVNCAAIPEELIESELFGHERGAFTGAVQQRKGKFDQANGGTLFLDEIADMSLKTQAKILRILQEQKFERVGGTQTISVDVRIIAATNKDLKNEILKGNFREDLYYRLNVIPFQIPALRDRKEDIPELAQHFLKEFSTMHGRLLRALTPEAHTVLSSYPWPGNVRELRNLIERIIILTSSQEEGRPITAANLLSHLKHEVLAPKAEENDYLSEVEKSGSSKNLRDARQKFEKDFILQSLRENDWNVSKTAQVLGIERSYLHRKIKSYGLDPDCRPNS